MTTIEAPPYHHLHIVRDTDHEPDCTRPDEDHEGPCDCTCSTNPGECPVHEPAESDPNQDALPDVGTFKPGGGSAGYITDPAELAALNAALAARTVYRYPTGWPQSLRPALDEVRRLLTDNGAPLAKGTWTWLQRRTSEHPARTFILNVERPPWRAGEYVVPDLDLPALLDRLNAGWRPAVPAKRKPARPSKHGHESSCECRCGASDAS